MDIAFLVAAAVGTCFWCIWWFREYRKKQRELHNQLKAVFWGGCPSESWIITWAARFNKSRYGSKMAWELSKLGLPWKPSDYAMYLLLIYAGVIWILKGVLGVPIALGMLMAAGIVAMAKRILFRMRVQMELKIFHRQLPDVCRILSNALRAGMTLPQGIELLAEELPRPARNQFQILHKELLLGVEIEKALTAFQERIGSKECAFLTRSILIQRQVGGNLVVVLENLAKTLEERTMLLQSMKTMTSEARSAAMILPIVPVILISLMNMMVEGFIQPLFTAPGLVLLVSFLFIQVTAFLLVRKVTRFKV